MILLCLKSCKLLLCLKSCKLLKNNVPRYLILDFKKVQEEQTLPNEDVMAISRKIIKQNKDAYEVLAK